MILYTELLLMECVTWGLLCFIKRNTHFFSEHNVIEPDVLS